MGLVYEENIVDKLDEIVKKQKELMERVVEERGHNWLKENKNKMLKHHILALSDETAELQREINWKWWVNDKEIDEEACKEELIDMIHFNLQALILLGCDANEIYNIYMGKNKENHKRQNGETNRKGYDPNSDEEYENVD
ncbi:MAG: dUTPase [Nanoarchaeota archaeon]